MKNLKKFVGFILAITIMFSSFSAAFAAPSTAQKLNELDLLANITQAELDAELTRVIGITMIMKSLGYEQADADAVAADSTFTDVVGDYAWAKGWVQLAYNEGITVGKVDGEIFDPAGKLTAKEFVSFQLRGLGYDPYESWNNVADLADANGLITNLNATTYTKTLAAEVMFAALSANLVGAPGTLLDKLIANGDVTEEAAISVGLIEEEVANYDIKSAVALNSKVIEITFEEAVSNVKASDFTVVDSANKVVAVANAKLAPYDADSKVALITLSNNTEEGKLYKVTANDTSANFGGLVIDDTEPTVVSVESTDYNEVTVTFSEPVDLSGLSFTANQKYGTKASLNLSLKEYDSSSVVVFTTDAQAASTLYGTVIEGAKDLAGNVMEKDEAKTFVGQAMDTDKQEVSSASIDDSVTVIVTFRTKVDKATALNPANYTITEKYGSKNEIAVVDAVINTDSDDNELPAQVKLTLGNDTTSGTLYKLAVKNVNTLYGVVLDTDKDETTFVGKDKDTAEPSIVAVTSDSNTEITVSFSDENGTDDLAADVDYSLVKVTKKYGDKAELAIALKEVEDNTIIFTTEAQTSATLYEVNVAKGIEDAKGNVSTEELTTTFVGSGIADEIKAITGITDNTATTNTIQVDFDQNYGDGALDVASYFIDGGIGYPQKVEEIDGDNNSVKLTVKKTETGKLYKLTVNNVKNSDGVAMDVDGLTKNFAGLGGATSEAPRLEAAVAVNDTTIKLYFDTIVEDITLFNITSNDTAAAEIAVTGGAASVTVSDAMVDPENEKVVIAYVGVGELADGGADNVFTVAVANAGLDTDYNAVSMAENDDAPVAVEIDGIVAQDSRTLTVYFNQAIRVINAATFAGIDDLSDANQDGAQDVEFASARALNDALTEWEFVTTSDMSDGQITFLVQNKTLAGISTVDAAFTTATFEADTNSYAFAGNDEVSSDITDVYAVMTDSRTIVVYYPEDMDITGGDGTDALNLANYVIENASDVDKTNGALADAKWDADTKTVTLTINANFTDWATSSNYYLEIADTVMNLGNTKTVNDGETVSAALEIQFAKSTIDPATVLVNEVTSDAIANTITIEFNQKLTTAANVDFAAGDGVADANLVALLNILVEGNTALTAANITDIVATLDDVDVNDTNAGAFDKLVITTNVDLTANLTGTVDFLDTITNAATGVNGEAADADMDEIIFVQK